MPAGEGALGVVAADDRLTERSGNVGAQSRLPIREG